MFVSLLCGCRRLWFCVPLAMLAIASQMSAAETGTPGEPSQADLEAIYKAVPPEDRAVIDTWPPEQKAQYLRQRARAAQLRAVTAPLPPPDKRTGPGPEQVAPELYVLDPLLREAFEAYVDENRPSVEAIRLFEEFAQRNPGSEFLPEVYFRIGALYSIHRRAGEPSNREKEIEFFRKAHALYGNRFEPLHSCAWASLANLSRSLAEQRRYYDWLLRLQATGALDDIHPVRQIEQTRNGRPPRMAKEDIGQRYDAMKRIVPVEVDTAEKNILAQASQTYASLAELAAAYPSTRLGVAASERLERLDRESANGAIRAMDGESFAVPAPAGSGTGVVKPQSSAEGLVGGPAASPLVPPHTAGGTAWARRLAIALAVVLGLGAGALAYARARHKRR